MKLRVWWIPQVPMNPFYQGVSTLKEAKLLLETLANYDIFQYKSQIKPDYSNAGGLEIWNEEENDWLEWEDEEGNNIETTDLDQIYEPK